MKSAIEEISNIIYDTIINIDVFKMQTFHSKKEDE